MNNRKKVQSYQMYVKYNYYFNTFLFFVVSKEPNPITLIISISSCDFPMRSWSVSFFPAPLGIYHRI